MTIRIVLKSLANGGQRHGLFAHKTVRFLEEIFNQPAWRDLVRAEHSRQEFPVAALGDSAAILKFLLNSDDFSLEIGLAVTLVVRDSGSFNQTASGETLIATPFWLIDNCLRSGDMTELAAHWLGELIRRSGRDNNVGAVPRSIEKDMSRFGVSDEDALTPHDTRTSREITSISGPAIRSCGNATGGAEPILGRTPPTRPKEFYRDADGTLRQIPPPAPDPHAETATRLADLLREFAAKTE